MVLDVRITSKDGQLTYTLVLSRRARRWMLALAASVSAAGGLSMSTIVDAIHRAVR